MISRTSILKIREFITNVRKINCTIYSADSCEQLSDFSEHPENQNKPHFLRCGKLKVFLIK